MGTERRVGLSGKSAGWGAQVHVGDARGLFVFYNVYSFLTSANDAPITSLSAAFSVDKWRVAVLKVKDVELSVAEYTNVICVSDLQYVRCTRG